MKNTITLCDVCRHIIPGALIEVRAVIIIHDNGHTRERAARFEVCGEHCQSSANAALMREVRMQQVGKTKESCHE